MSRYLEIAEEEMRKIRARRKLEKTRGGGSGLPWRGYNGGQQFACEKCGTWFDTSAGIAKHEVYGCDSGTFRNSERS